MHKHTAWTPAYLAVVGIAPLGGELLITARRAADLRFLEEAIGRWLPRTYREGLASRYRALWSWVWPGDRMPAPGMSVEACRAEAGSLRVLFLRARRPGWTAATWRVGAGGPGGDGRGCLLWPCCGSASRRGYRCALAGWVRTGWRRVVGRGGAWVARPGSRPASASAAEQELDLGVGAA